MSGSVFQSCYSLASFLAAWRQLGQDQGDLRAIASGLLQKDRAWQIAHAGDRLDEGQALALREGLQRRLLGEPVAYILGYREFYGLQLRVNSAVLIPRPETELLVELVCSSVAEGGKVLDVGTGSGAIALAIAHTRPDLQVAAVDISEDALEVASANAKELALCGVSFARSDLLEGLDNEKPFQAIVSNPPYIADSDPHLGQGDLRFEPKLALSDFGDGLRIIERLIDRAPAHLFSGGLLAIEHGFEQGEAVRALFAGSGRFTGIETLKDLAGLDRVTKGFLRPS